MYRIPPMPTVNKPRPTRPTNSYGQTISGYVESIESQAQNNSEAIDWFFRHHEAIGEAVRIYNAIEQNKVSCPEPEA